MNPLNIAIAVQAFPNILQTYILNHLASLKKSGVNITVIAREKRHYKTLPSIISDQSLMDDVIYIDTSAKGIFKAALSPPIFNAAYRAAVSSILKFSSWEKYEKSYVLKAIMRARAITQGPFDILHSHSFFTSYNYLFMKDVLSIPLVTTYHGQVPRGVNKLDERKLKKVLQTGDVFLTNTEYARDELIQLGCDKAKIRIIPQGLLLDKFTFRTRHIDPGQKIRLLTIGRLSIEKGHQVVLQAVQKLSTDYPNIEYHIVGDGPLKSSLLELCHDYSISERVIFHGTKTGKEIQNILATADIFVLPSTATNDGYLVETQGVVLQEAQASGIPVIGTRVGGIPDVIENNETGLLFDDGDFDELAVLIENLVSNPSLYEKLSTSGRKDVENRFDINLIARQLIDLYLELSR